MTSAFIIGYTGATGNEIVKQLSRDTTFKTIVLIGRRDTRLPVDNDGRFVQKIIDYDKIEEHGEAFKGCDVGFCCLGTTKAKSGADGFVRVDRDYVVNCAKVALTAGCKHFQVISASTSDRNSCILYNRTKGEVEDQLQELTYERLSIFRPAFILTEREDRRFLEKVALCCLCPVLKCCPTYSSVPVEYLAAAMINNATKGTPAKVETISNAELHVLGNP